jgi:hypothetical protein
MCSLIYLFLICCAVLIVVVLVAFPEIWWLAFVVLVVAGLIVGLRQTLILIHEQGAAEEARRNREPKAG